MKAPGPFPLVADIDRVMNVAPLGQITGETPDERAQREEDCRVAVAAVLRRLHEHGTMTPSEVRRRIKKYADALRRAADAHRELPEWVEAWLPVDPLNKMKEEADRLTAPSGIGVKKLDAARLRLSAQLAFDLLMDFMNIAPTRTAGGAWPELTRLLHKIATGKDGGDALRACQWCVDDFQGGGLYDDEEMRAIARAAKAKERIRSAEERAIFWAWLEDH
jgi:hypothetical protein